MVKMAHQYRQFLSARPTAECCVFLDCPAPRVGTTSAIAGNVFLEDVLEWKTGMSQSHFLIRRKPLRAVVPSTNPTQTDLAHCSVKQSAGFARL
jgi:hypothetical protein